MSPPAKELMNLVLENRIAHCAHPFISWMMDNIFIHTDRAGNTKPDKEKSTEKIVGAVATIMALSRAIRNGALVEPTSMNNERGIFELLDFFVDIHYLVDYYFYMEKNTVSSIVNKSFTLNGKTVNKLMSIYSICEYDEKGNEIHYKDSDNTELWDEYDANGNNVYSKNIYGDETWFEYDANGKLIHSKFSDVKEVWYEYDTKGNKIHTKYSDGKEEWYEYDAKGNNIHNKHSDGFEEWYEHDANGNFIHALNSRGNESWYEYDAKGNIIYSKHSYDETWYKYDANGNEIYAYDLDGYERWCEYDANGKLIHNKDSEGNEEYYEYEYYPNGIISKEICYKSI